MCPSAIFGPLSLTTLGSPVCWKVTAVTAAAQPTAALFSFAKPISILLGAPRTDSTTLLASFLSEARTRTNARSFTSNEYSFITPHDCRPTINSAWRIRKLILRMTDRLESGLRTLTHGTQLTNVVYLGGL